MRCYCGSKTNYTSCCQPLHNGVAKAATAEQLMRSRFSAFCTGNSDYLSRTLHPSKRTAGDKAALDAGFANTRWLGLTILGHTATTVEFVAFYTSGSFGQLHENSTFLCENGEWFYLQGTMLGNIKIGRNQPCPCGNGKKFKQCCAKHSENTGTMKPRV